ncbi:MAG: adenylyl-sulfate kinase [Actinomycetota bacterium]|nr:adenylyl-sulfate kinase [Actinomycetota bacterium]
MTTPLLRSGSTAGRQPARERGATVWLTGLPSAGKSTLAAALAERLRADGRRVEVLDGDEVREFLTAGLGFSKADRDTNIARIGFVADLLARNGVTVITAAIAPYADARAAVRARHERSGTPFLEVYVAAPVEVCAERDVKGLYAKQRAGELTGLTGVDDPYEPPAAPELTLQTHEQSPAESVEALMGALAGRGLA